MLTLPVDSVAIITTFHAEPITAVALDPALPKETRKFLTKLNADSVSPLKSLSPSQARQDLFNTQASVKDGVSNTNVTKKTSSRGLAVQLHLVRPIGIANKVLPGLIFSYGGGWVLGSFSTQQRLVCDLVVASGYAAVFVNYMPGLEIYAVT